MNEEIAYEVEKMRDETLKDKIVTDERSQHIGYIHAGWVKQTFKDILNEIKLECKPYDMLYGEVGNRKLRFEQIKQIIKQKTGFEDLK